MIAEIIRMRRSPYPGPQSYNMLKRVSVALANPNNCSEYRQPSEKLHADRSVLVGFHLRRQGLGEESCDVASQRKLSYRLGITESDLAMPEDEIDIRL